MTPFRTDTHNNPAAFTTDVAAEARLKLGVDYTVGDGFTAKFSDKVRAGNFDITLHTARLIGDPIALTIRVIDALSFQTTHGTPISRWGYITMPGVSLARTLPSSEAGCNWMDVSAGRRNYNEASVSKLRETVGYAR